MNVHDLSTHQLQIRAATPDDAGAVAEVAERIFTRTFGPLNSAADIAAYAGTAFGESIQRRELEDPDGEYLLSFVDTKLVAFAQLRHGATDPTVHGDAPVEIQRFYVDHDFHGRGVAARLMEACVEAATARTGRTLWLGVWERNARAIRFYEKCGFVDVGSHPFQLGQDRQTDRVMMRRIGPTPSPDPVRLSTAFARVHEHWQPMVVGALNGQQVKVVKFQGEFVWHHHDDEDELFLVHRGRFAMEFRDRTVTLEAGDFLIVPRGVEHRPVATEEVEVVLFEPVGIVRTGNVEAPSKAD